MVRVLSLWQTDAPVVGASNGHGEESGDEEEGNGKEAQAEHNGNGSTVAAAVAATAVVVVAFTQALLPSTPTLATQALEPPPPPHEVSKRLIKPTATTCNKEGGTG